MWKQACRVFTVRSIVTVASLVAALTIVGATGAYAASTIKTTKIAGPYKLTLMIGPAETMSMSAKGNADERMMGGASSSDCSMAMHMAANLTRAAKMATCNHHVEVHVYNKSNGKVLTKAAVTIAMQGKSMTIHVPIMMMEGMKAGPSDFHYGNNVYAPAGKYTVHVTVNTSKANFIVNLGGGM